MHRTPSNLGPALLLAVGMLVAAGLAVMAPHGSWTVVAGPLLLVLALFGADLLLRRRAGLDLMPSTSVLVTAAAMLVACGIVAVRDVDGLPGMIPLLGSCAALPVIQQRRARPAARVSASAATGSAGTCH